MENENPTFSQQPFAEKQNLPNATSALVLGIISIPTCCLFYGVPGIVCGILALIFGNKAIKLYSSNSDAYTLSSFKNAKAGRVCGIIGLSLATVALIMTLIVVFVFGMEGIEEWAKQMQEAQGK